MAFPDRRALITAFITFLIISEMLAYVATTPRPREQFFKLYVLGSNHMAADYYPNNNSDIPLNERVLWYLGVTDFMGSAQLVAVRVKLGNETIQPPDDQQAVPSPAPVMTEFKRFIQDNETWEFPFVWRVTDAVFVDDTRQILESEINGERYRVADWSARGGHNFRLIFELWTYDVDSGSFQFGWTASAERRVAWLQVWFNMTSPMRLD